MHVRHLSILMLAALTLVAACGSDDTPKASGKSHTITTSNPPMSSNVPTTVAKPKISFADGEAQMEQSLAAAKGDACKLYDFSDELASVENPSSADEDKDAANLLAEYFMDIADVMQSEHAAEATALRTETTKFTQQAAAAGYKLTDPSLTALNDKAFQQAFATFQQETSSCASATTTTVAKS